MLPLHVLDNGKGGDHTEVPVGERERMAVDQIVILERERTAPEMVDDRGVPDPVDAVALGELRLQQKVRVFPAADVEDAALPQP